MMYTALCVHKGCQGNRIEDLERALSERTRERDDYKADYFRRHKDAGDELEKRVIAEGEIGSAWAALGKAQAPATDHIYNSIEALAADRDAELARAEAAERERDELQKQLDDMAVPVATNHPSADGG